MSLTVLIHGRAERDPSAPSLTFDAPRIVLGRGDGCEVRLPDVSVNHRHATLRQRGSEYLLVDEGSTNGTRIGRVRLPPQSPRVIRSGELARVGRVWVEFRIDGTPVTMQAPTASKEVALGLVIASLEAAGEDARPTITVAGDDPVTAIVPIEGRLVVGRSSEAGLSIDDPDLSRRHAEIGRKGDVLVVRDLGSKVGTTIDDRAVGTSDVVWKRGETLAIGGARLTYAFEAVDALLEIERAPVEAVAQSELEGAEPVIEAPADAAPEALDESDAPSDDEDDFALADVRPPPASRVRWSFTDFAVVVLALGVLSLSAVGYFVMLR